MKQTEQNQEYIFYCLIRNWAQHTPSATPLRGIIAGETPALLLQHSCIRAYEDAGELLEEYGLARDNGSDMVVTKLGLELLDQYADYAIYRQDYISAEQYFADIALKKELLD
jgi:hypothetical protein